MEDLVALSPTSALSHAADHFSAFVRLHKQAQEQSQLEGMVNRLMRLPCKHCGRPLFECFTKQDAGETPALKLLRTVLGEPEPQDSEPTGGDGKLAGGESPTTGKQASDTHPSLPAKKGRAVKVQSKGETFVVNWNGSLDTWGNPKGRGTLYWQDIKFTGVWGTATEDSYGYPIDPPKFLSRTDSASMVPDLAEFPDGSVFQGVLGAWPQQGILLCKGTGTLTLKSGHYVKGKWVSQGTVFRDNNVERIDRSLWKWAD